MAQKQAIANGGMGQLAKRTHLPRQNPYHTLSSRGNPSLKKLKPILGGLGFHLYLTNTEPCLARVLRFY